MIVSVVAQWRGRARLRGAFPVVMLLAQPWPVVSTRFLTRGKTQAAQRLSEVVSVCRQVDCVVTERAGHFADRMADIGCLPRCSNSVRQAVLPCCTVIAMVWVAVGLCGAMQAVVVMVGCCGLLRVVDCYSVLWAVAVCAGLYVSTCVSVGGVASSSCCCGCGCRCGRRCCCRCFM